MRAGLLCLCLALCACQSLAPPDTGATLRARERQILDDATAIARNTGDDLLRARETIAYRSTEIAGMQLENAVLLVTVRAGNTPTPRPAGDREQQPPLTPGSQWFSRTGLSRFINAANGCVEAPQVSFSSATEVLYVTLRAWNVTAGLNLGVQWWHEGEPVHSEGFTLARASRESCYWFSLSPDMVTFAPGSWRVQLYADGVPIQSPQSFTMRAATTGMDG